MLLLLCLYLVLKIYPIFVFLEITNFFLSSRKSQQASKRVEDGSFRRRLLGKRSTEEEEGTTTTRRKGRSHLGHGCPSKKVFLHPQVGFSVSGRWLYVVNLPGRPRHQQGVLSEQCL